MCGVTNLFSSRFSFLTTQEKKTVVKNRRIKNTCPSQLSDQEHRKYLQGRATVDLALKVEFARVFPTTQSLPCLSYLQKGEETLLLSLVCVFPSRTSCWFGSSKIYLYIDPWSDNKKKKEAIWTFDTIIV